MPSKKSARPSQRRMTAQEEDRERIRKALRAAVKRERDIQVLSKKFRAAMQRSNDGLQSLAVDLAARARALEADQETRRVLNG